MLSEERLDAIEKVAQLAMQGDEDAQQLRLQPAMILALIAAARRERELRRLVEAMGPWPIMLRVSTQIRQCGHCGMRINAVQVYRNPPQHYDNCEGVAIAAWLAEHGGEW